MVRVLGNSPERVKISDLNDVIYYHQTKEYTDQEFESSKDLKKEITKGRVTILEKSQPVRITGGDSQAVDSVGIKKIISDILSGFIKPSVDINDIKKLLSEMIVTPEIKHPQEIKKIMMEVLAEQKIETGAPAQDITALLPLIVDTLRQEISRIQIAGSHGIIPKAPTFMGPEYIPTINTEGMISNVKSEERTASGGDMAGALEALKKFQKSE